MLKTFSTGAVIGLLCLYACSLFGFRSGKWGSDSVGKIIYGLQERQVDQPEGLKLHEVPESHSQVITVLPQGSVIRLLKTSFRSELVSGMQGHWAFVQYGSDEGWVFDAFLKPLSAPFYSQWESEAVELLSNSEKTMPEIFRSMSITALLKNSTDLKRRQLGRLTKKPGRMEFKVDTLRRLCGFGRPDLEPQMDEDGIFFFIEYAWCDVDPGVLEETRCINCDITMHHCRIDEDLLEHKSALNTEIECSVFSSNFCQSDCFD